MADEIDRANDVAARIFKGGKMSKDPWQHRSSGMKCGTCMWFVEKLSEPKGKTIDGREAVPDLRGPLGRCRRHAPTMQGFPATFAVDWCGDHKLDESRL